MAPRQQLVISGLLAFVASAPLPAQEWRWEKIDAVGIKFQACGRLERIPMKFGEGNVHQHARLRPREVKDYINGTYPWYCDVYEFPKPDPQAPVKASQDEPDEDETEEDKKRREFLKRLASFGLGSGRHDSFEDWVDAQQVKLVLKGKSTALNVHEPLGVEDFKKPATSAYADAYQKMQAADPAAVQAFAAYVGQFGEDPLATFHLQRLLSGNSGTRIQFPD